MAASERTHYDVLGLARDADASAVRTAWKLHVQAWHPDRFSGDMRVEAERQTSRINEAYTTLRDASRRAAYDCRLAADESAARREPEPRRAAKVRPAAPRPAATPIGAPMASAEPLTIGGHVAEMIDDAGRILRRHPRSVAAAAALLVLLLGGSAMLHLVSAPSLPSSTGTVTAAPASSSAIVANDDQVEDLEDLAERARAEAAEADKELQQLMAEDAAAAKAEARAAARQAALAAQAASRAVKKKQAQGARSATPRTGTRRIVRVMPTGATV